MKKGLLTMAGMLLTVSLVSAGTTVPVLADEETTLVYGSGDYTRINPAMDEHGEINILIFNGLTAHDGDNQVVPGLAESWEFDDATNTYTFHMAEDAKWQDGEPVTADDVKFTIEAIMDPENGSENAPNYEDVEEINVVDDHTVEFKLEDKNVAFLDYMTMAVLPKHLLEGEDMQTSDFFRNPVGTGPYKIESWDEGQAITLAKNEDYFKGEPSIDKIVFKIVPDDNAKALQLKSGELDLALLTPKDAAAFAGDDAYTCYDIIDRIEHEVGEKLGILLVIHMDPVEIHDATVLATKEKVRNVISILDPELSFHDFRMINGAEKKKLIFDLEIPYSYKKKDCDRVIGQIGALMKEMDEKYECVVNIDKKYVAGE